MKRLLKTTATILVYIGLVSILHSCKKPSVPVLSTTSVSGITATTAVSGGNITSNGGEDVTARGVCWGITQKPTTSSNKTNDGTGNGEFSSNITGLAPHTTYYVRAYATNTEGTGYGNELTFTTSCETLSPPVPGTITQPTCALATGSVALSGLPATGTWTLTRTPGGTTTTGTGTSTVVSGLEAGSYTFTVNAAAGCVSAPSGNVVINSQPASISPPVTGTITQPTCAVATGSVALSGLPATGSWTITRTPGGTTSTGTGTGTTISGLEAGIYAFTVTDAVGCVSAASGNVVINPQPASVAAPVVGTITQPSCAVATGSVVMIGLPSTGTWTLTRTPGGTTSSGTGASTTISGLAAGTFTFTVTDASGCVSAASGNVVLNAPAAAPSAPVVGTITQPTCAVATGTVLLSGLPSTGTWTLTRTPGGSTTTGTGASTTISGLAAGTYTFTVADASGCNSEASGNAVINAQPVTPSAPVVGAITQPNCAVATGSVVLSGLPSSGSWTLTRTPGGTTNTGSGANTTVSGLAAGTYTFTVTNSSGCISTASGNVVINAQPTSPSAPVIGTITQPTCAVPTGSVVLSGLPLTGTWTITRSPGGTTYTGTASSTTISLLSPGTTYTFTVAVSSGCPSVASNNVVIGSIAAPSAITLNPASGITPTTATLSGYVNGNGSLTTVTFEYGLSTSYASSVPANQSPITDNRYVSATVSSLADHALYHYRIKAVNCAGTVYSTPDMMFTTLCLSTLEVDHKAGSTGAPVDKNITYNITHTNLTGSDKCWIIQNLGAYSYAVTATESTEPNAGWYWQFNRKQGYKHDGTTRTPNYTWITTIEENANWTVAYDPCVNLLGNGWRLPTQTEWTAADNNGAWDNFNDTYNSVLKLHAAGYLNLSTGGLYNRGSYGRYWSNTQNTLNPTAYGYYLYLSSISGYISNTSKSYGFTVRCIKD